MLPTYGRKYSASNVADEKSLIGVDGYCPPSAEVMERLSWADLKSHLARSNELLMKTANDYMKLLANARNRASLDYDEITKLREHYRPTCEHEWGAEWHETNHAYRRCRWCYKIDKRAGGGAWVGD